MAGPNYIAVTPSDTTVYSPAIVWLYVGTTGDVAVLGKNDTTAVTLKAVPQGTQLVFRYPVQKVMATGTTASTLIACATG